jgi:ParB-like chromosome segregation protein Spo0J
MMSTLFDQLPSLAKVADNSDAELAQLAPIIAKFLDPQDSISGTPAGLERKVNRLNAIRRLIAEHSPFESEPVDLVEWIAADSVHANDYNPNTVAPPEMELLRLSIMADGYTQPIVTMPDDDGRVVIDGFHRHRVGKEMPDVAARIHGYLPVVRIRQDREDRNDRIASTIRHNRARGKHRIDAMSDIVVELKRRNWADERIARELGMEADEVLRLCQVSGIADLFSDDEFSASWDVADPDDDFTGFDEEQVLD